MTDRETDPRVKAGPDRPDESDTDATDAPADGAPAGDSARKTSGASDDDTAAAEHAERPQGVRPGEAGEDDATDRAASSESSPEPPDDPPDDPEPHAAESPPVAATDPPTPPTPPAPPTPAAPARATAPVPPAPRSSETARPDRHTPTDDRDHRPDAPPVPPVPPTTPAPPVTEAGRRGGPGALSLTIAGVIGAAIALVVFFLAQSVGIMPTPGRAETEEALRRVAVLEARMADDALFVGALQDRVEQMGDQLNTQINDVALSGAGQGELLASLSGDLVELRALVDGLSRSGSVSPDDLADAVSDLEARIAAAGGGAESDEALARVGFEIDALRARLEDLAAAAARTTTGPGAASPNTMALLLLERAAAAGGPFPVEAAAAAEVLPASEDVGRMTELAAEGAPSFDQLRSRFPDVATAIRQARREALLAGDGVGTGERFGKMLEGLFGGAVSVRRSEDPDPVDDRGAIAAITAALAAGDLQAAVAEHALLTEEEQRASADWASDARRRLTIDRLIAQLVVAPGDEAEGG